MQVRIGYLTCQAQSAWRFPLFFVEVVTITARAGNRQGNGDYFRTNAAATLTWDSDGCKPTSAERWRTAQAGFRQDLIKVDFVHHAVRLLKFVQRLPESQL